MKVLVFDNYDSFTYNLVHLVEKIIDQNVVVCRNDSISLEDIDEYDKILLSPGPGIPEEAGLLLPLIKTYAHSKSILGVCLGHQAIGQAFGAGLINLTQVYHGVATPIDIIANGSSLYEGLPTEIEVGRYHSWVVDPTGLPSCLKVTALDKQGHIMGLEHATFDVQGVQFHPESVLTPQGETIIKNWLKR